MAKEEFAYRFPCIKCKTAYDTNEDEAYYCPKCKVEKDTVAAKLDKQFDTTRPKPMSALEQFDAQAKVFKGSNGRTISFGKA